ncbi:MAG: ATP-binding protein [Candidatus Omnitrophota bacterium]
MKKHSPRQPHSKKKTAFSRRSSEPYGKPFGEKECHGFCRLTSDMIQVFKVEGALLDANPAWHQALGYNEKDIPQLTVFNIIHPKDKKEAEDVFLAVLRDGKPRKFQATFIGKSGKELKVEGAVTRILHRSRPFALSGVFHDVTRYKHYDQLKGEFISTVSHELRTPLTVIREGVSQIRDELLGPVPDNQKAFLDMVLQNSDRLGRIIEELLDVSRLEAGQVNLHRRRCDLVEVAQEVAENFKPIAQRKKLEIFTDFMPGTIEIYIDRDKIVQVLNHLIHNALKFTDKGHIKIHLRVREGFVECKVSDTGKGIAAKDLPHAFQNFSQFGRMAGPGDRGTGLGLSICKQLIELHHGRIKIESAPAKGTTATFVLPQYNHREYFKSAIREAMGRCEGKESPLSVIIFDILDFEALEKKLGVRYVERIVLKMEKIINDALRRVVDVAVKDAKAIMVLLPETSRESAFIALGRISQILEDHLAREQKTVGIEVHGNVVCFPQEAKTLEEILDRIYS